MSLRLLGEGWLAERVSRTFLHLWGHVISPGQILATYCKPNRVTVQYR